MASQINIGGLSAGLSGGETVIGPVTIVGTNAVGASFPVNLAPGDNTIAIPPLTSVVLIVPPSGNGNAIKVRTNLNSGDAGLPLSPNDPLEYSYRGLGATSLIINAAGTVSAVQLWFI